MEYVFQGSGSGAIGLSSFTDAIFRVFLYADAADVGPYAGFSDVFIIRNITDARVEIEGVGAAAVTQALYLFDNQSGSAGIGRESPFGDFFSVGNPVFQTYDLTAPLFTTASSGNFPEGALATELGDFSPRSAVTDASFSASFAVTATPEPARVGAQANHTERRHYPERDNLG